MPWLRFRSALNWLPLSVNILLLVYFASHWLLPADQTIARARKNAAMLDMDVYFAKDPFVLVVDKEFPRTRSFTLLVDEEMLVISLIDTAGQRDAEPKRELSVSLGTEFSISCDYSVIKEAPWASVKRMTLSREDEQGLVGLMDLNADGVYDMRIRRRGQQSLPTQIWYQREWQDVLAHDGLYKKQLPGVGEVTFDTESGRWLTSEEDPPNDPD